MAFFIDKEAFNIKSKTWLKACGIVIYQESPKNMVDVLSSTMEPVSMVGVADVTLNCHIANIVNRTITSSSILSQL
jgi:hypothetical protein